MEAAGLSDDAFALEEEEDLAIEAAKTIVSRGTAKLRQLGVDLEFSRGGDVCRGGCLGSGVPGSTSRAYRFWRHGHL